MTKYVILRWRSEVGAYAVHEEEVSASSPRRALVAAKVEAGEYVAVPARSFKQLTVAVEQTTKVTIT